MTRYRLDNTDGYTQPELDRLNVRFEERVEFSDEQDDQTVEWIAEQVLAEYDTALTHTRGHDR